MARLEAHQCWPLTNDHLVGSTHYKATPNISRKPRLLLK